MVKHKTPYSDLLPPLSTEDFDALKQSVKAEGVRDPVWLDELGNVLDGHHRLKIDANAPIRVVSGSKDWSEAQRKAWIFKANFERRQLSPEQRSEANSARREIAKQLSSEGCKQKEIGLLLGAAQQTISDWLKDISTGSGTANNPSPRLVIPREEHETIVERLASGETQEQVAADYGVSQGRISQVVNAVESKRQQDEQRDAERRQQNKQLSKPTPDAIKSLQNSPGILVGANWWRPRDEDWIDQLLDWKLADRLDDAGGIIVFRTLADTRALLEALSLLESWGAEPLPYQVAVTGIKGAEWQMELLAIGVTGKPNLLRLPTKKHNLVHCPDAGVESLVLSWFKPWAKERGTPNLIAEILGTEPHEGFQYHPWKPEQTAA